MSVSFGKSLSNLINDLKTIVISFSETLDFRKILKQKYFSCRPLYVLDPKYCYLLVLTGKSFKARASYLLSLVYSKG